LTEERPYRFEIAINSNSESNDKNFIKLRLLVQLPLLYPNDKPQVRVKNLSPEIISNNKMIEFEEEVGAKIEESMGSPVIYEVCEILRSKISDMNELILDKLREHDESHSLTATLSRVHVTSKDTMSFTPVTQETFAKWCLGYMEKLKMLKDAFKTENDLKPSGRQLFEDKMKLGNLGLDDLEEDEEEFKDDKGTADEEEFDEPEEGCGYYDKDLYAQEEGLQEDVDFD